MDDFQRKVQIRRQIKEVGPACTQISEIRPVITGRRPAKRKWGKLYHTRRWKVLRNNQLKHNPLCVLCGELASDVDHIVRHRGDKNIFHDPNNLQSLCFQCHVNKTRAERKQIG